MYVTCLHSNLISTIGLIQRLRALTTKLLELEGLKPMTDIELDQATALQRIQVTITHLRQLGDEMGICFDPECMSTPM